MSVSRSYPTEAISSPPVSFLQPQSGLAIPRPSRSHEITLDWLAAAERIGVRVDLDTSAHMMGAMLRRRGVPSATNLLCLAFLYGPARMPLRLIAERSAIMGIAKVSEPALLRRLINAADWLEHLAGSMIQIQLDALAHQPGSNTIATTERLHTAAGAHDRSSRQVETAKRFILDFVPWPEDLYTDAQVHWLLCLRWMFVTSTIKDGPVLRAEGIAPPAPPLERTRAMAHLLGALS